MQKTFFKLLFDHREEVQNSLIYLFSFLGFIALPRGFGTRVWYLLIWFIFINIALLTGLDKTTLFYYPVGFLLLSQAPWLLFAGELWTRGNQAIGLDSVSLRSLIFFQSIRLVGLFFILGGLSQRIPLQFAIQVGMGELLVGVGASLLSLIYSPQFGLRFVVLVWNAFGLVSLLYIQTKLFLSHPELPFHRLSPEIFRLMDQWPTNWLIYFWYPLCICLHLAIFAKLMPGPGTTSVPK